VFAAPPVIETEVFASVPTELRRTGHQSEWTHVMRHDAPTDCFLEGPSFDREGNLFVVDIPFGRILKVSSDRKFEVIAEYDGEPCALKFDKAGRAYLTDFKHGLMSLDVRTGEVKPHLERRLLERFKGVNDLVFADNGDLYFTDQGQSGIADATGRVWRLRANGELQKLVTNAPSPNGVTLNNKNTQVYVAITRAQQIWRLPLMSGGTPSKTGVAIQLSGGHAGPDGIEMDAEDGLVVCHFGVGIWRFDANMLPTHLVHSGKQHRLMTNIAFQGKRLFVTDSLNGEILMADMPVAGKKMYSGMK